MPVYLDTRGNSVLSVAVCDRCSRKFAYTELYPDPNFPGMRVCKEDLDQFDPWRLPARQTENIALRFPRPDVSVARTDSQLLTQGNLNNYSPGDSFFIDGTPPYGGAQGDISLDGSGNNSQGNYPNPTPPNAPTVTGFTPTSGTENGGTLVTITGTGFIGTSVQFGSVYAEFTVVNETTIEAISPRGVLGESVAITVTTGGGSGVSSQKFTYTASAPKVYSITPNTGDAAGGESVVIGGYRFTGATSVRIGNTEVPSYTVIDDTTISATTPEAFVNGAVDVAVTTTAGTGIGRNLFTYENAPAYVGFTGSGTYTVPAGINKLVVLTVGHGANGDTNIFSTNKGGGYGGQVVEEVQNVNPGDIVNITIGGYGVNTVATNGVWTQTSLAATTANTGGSDHGGGGAGNNGANPGSGGGFGVNGGAGGPGELSEITGEYYGGGGGGAAAGNMSGAVGGAGGIGGGGNGADGYNTPRPAANGTANTGGGGGGALGANTTGGTGFAAILPLGTPTITGLSPNDGGISGGDTITITGTNFTKATEVTIAGIPATFTILSYTTIEVVTPAHAVGSVNVTVTNPVGTGTATNAFTYYDIAIPFEALFVGGGGGGGMGNGGNGGTVLETSETLTRKSSTVYVGTGGAGAIQFSSPSVQGRFSGIQYTGVAIYAVGGTGGGGSSSGCGGSGGFGAYNTNGGGTGSCYSPWNGGDGGSGVASSMSGTSVVYAGGGGGGSVSYNQSAVGGTGGGGNGAYYSQMQATNGTDGLGGGGGGGAAQSPIINGGTGGSGISIIRYLTSDAVGYTITGGTKIVNGLYTIHTFTSTGTLVIN